MLTTLFSGDILKIVLELFSLLIVLFISFPVHECAHAFAAKLLGDDTAERQGRLTLNPFVHLDLLGTIGLMLFGIGWAKPVPVQPYRCRKVKSQKTAMALTALAGPVSNVLISLIFILIMKIVVVVFPGDMQVYVTPQVYYMVSDYTIALLIAVLSTVISINLYLGVFNLIPIPPFDGSRLFLAFLPQKYYFKVMQYERYIMFGILILLWTNILDIPLAFLTNLIYQFLDLITSFIC